MCVTWKRNVLFETAVFFAERWRHLTYKQCASLACWQCVRALKRHPTDYGSATGANGRTNSHVDFLTLIIDMTCENVETNNNNTTCNTERGAVCGNKVITANCIFRNKQFWQSGWECSVVSSTDIVRQHGLSYKILTTNHISVLSTIKLILIFTILHL